MSDGAFDRKSRGAAGAVALGCVVSLVLACAGVRSDEAGEAPAMPAVAASPLGAAATPALGRVATPEEAAGWVGGITPDGRGLPEGHGTAEEGEPVYVANCVRCHGLEGQGEPADRLVGGVGTLAGPRPIRTVGSYWPYATTLFDYVRRAMPYDRPGSLSDDEVYALCAYLLNLNGVIPAELELTRETLPGVRMPNRDGFVDVSGAAPSPPPPR